MTVRYIDVHSHLQFEQFAHDEEKLVNEIQEQGVAAIVVGIDYASSKKAVALAEKYENLYAAVGQHPNIQTAEQYDISYYRVLAAHPKVVAIGECGLDYYRPVEMSDVVKRVQKELLQKQVALAVALNKPLIIHCRSSRGTQDAYQDLVVLLKEAKAAHSGLRGDVHFFVGNAKMAEAFFELDFFISFTAVITFTRDYDEVIRATPLRNILAETDAPYIAPAARRGERNDPLAVVEVVAKIAEIRGEDLETVRTALLANAKRVFALP